MNQIQIQLWNNETIFVDFEEQNTVQELKQIIAEKGYHADNMNLYFSGKALEDECILATYNVQANNTIQASVPMVGGGIEPTIAAIAKKYNIEKKVCRDCYARLPPKAHNCRKRKCGHSNALRIKKKPKD